MIQVSFKACLRLRWDQAQRFESRTLSEMQSEGLPDTRGKVARNIVAVPAADAANSDGC